MSIRSRINNIRTRLRRFTYRIKTTILAPQRLILFAALVLCAFWTVSAISTMSRNWEQQRAVEAARLEKARSELELAIARENQTYYRSAEYQELVARTILSKAREGETLVTLPKNSERAKNKYVGTATTSTTPDSTSNFSQWLKFLFG